MFRQYTYQNKIQLLSLNKTYISSMHHIFTIVFLLLYLVGSSQTIDPSRSVNWTLAGLKDTTTLGFLSINLNDYSLDKSGLTPNDSVINAILNSVPESGAILNFPAGNFLFSKTIRIPSHVILRGQGAESTLFTMSLNGSGHSIIIEGSSSLNDTSSIIASASKDSSVLRINDSNLFSEGDWIKILQNDSDLVTSSWALNTVGQVVQIQKITANTIVLKSPLRMNYDLARSPKIVKIIPSENVGIECLKIHRIDSTAPEQSSNITFSYAVNCWVNGIESENCTFSHIQASHSSNLSFSKSYFHHGFNYGGDGRAYGVMLQATSNECLVENNIFNHLRHSMILQSGANGNVFTYNYSFDPFWNTAPNNAAGDMVLHGNYPYANLFEQNICQNIIIDNSHGPNGPHNTIFRNRAEGFGIFFSADNSPNQNIVGNDIPNINFPYSIVNFTIQGIGHFLYGNNNKGKVYPEGTDTLYEPSLAYNQKPRFVSFLQWAKLGTPNKMGDASIPSYDRYQSGTIFKNACSEDIYVEILTPDETVNNVLIFPNPIHYKLTIESNEFIDKLNVINTLGQLVYTQKNVGFMNHINSVEWQSGVYFVVVYFSNNQSTTQIILKQN